MATGYPSSRKLRQRADLSVRPTEQGCPGKLLRRQSEKNRRPYFVLAGLDPAIHALGCSKQRRGCAGQAAQDDLRSFPTSLTEVRLAGKLSPDSPALSQE